MSNELMREFQEDMQRERLHQLWKKFGNLIIGVSIAVVLATILGVGYRHWQAARAQAHTHTLLEAIKLSRAGDAKAVDMFDALVADSRGELRAIAALRQAEALNKQDKREEAGRKLADVAQKSTGTPFAELAVLEAQALGALPPGTAEEGAPFASTRQELTGWAKLESGKQEEAAAIFAALKDDKNAPMSLRERAFQLLSRIAPEKLPPTAELKKDDAKE